MNLGCFGVDPGGATGLAWGIFDPGAGGVAEALKTRLHAGSTTVDGEERRQIKAIATAWGDFYQDCVHTRRLPPENIYLVMENFIYTGANYAGDSAKISTAIIWGLEGYRMGRRDEWKKHRRGRAHMPTMVLQNAGDAKAFAKPDLLKEWGVWVVGRDHERSAWQHIAYFLQRYRIQYRL